MQSMAGKEAKDIPILVVAAWGIGTNEILEVLMKLVSISHLFMELCHAD